MIKVSSVPIFVFTIIKFIVITQLDSLIELPQSSNCTIVMLEVPSLHKLQLVVPYSQFVHLQMAKVKVNKTDGKTVICTYLTKI